jgi:hypothetical protein
MECLEISIPGVIAETENKYTCEQTNTGGSMDKFLVVISPKNNKRWIFQEDFAQLMRQGLQFKVIAKVVITDNIVKLTPYTKPVTFSAPATSSANRR